MAKEEQKTPTIQDVLQEGKTLTQEQIDAVAQLGSQLEGQCNYLKGKLEFAYNKLKEAENQIELYRMQDYYQRAGLLLEIIKNDKMFGNEFMSAVYDEFTKLIYPPESEPQQGDAPDPVKTKENGKG